MGKKAKYLTPNSKLILNPPNRRVTTKDVNMGVEFRNPQSEI